MKTLFTTFYCDYNNNNYYKNSAISLEKKIKSLGGNIILHAPELIGTYNTICLIKPTIILNTLNQYKQNIIWIDADCTVNELPVELDNIEYDIGAVIRIHDMKTPHSALIFFKYNDRVLSFVKDWEQKFKKLEEELS